MPTKLSSLIQTTPRSMTVEVPCEMACGRTVRDWVLVQTRGVGLAVTDESNVPFTMQLRVCSPCFETFIYDITATAKDVGMAHQKRGGK